MTEDTKSQLQILINENLKLSQEEYAIACEKNDIIMKKCLEYIKLYKRRKLELAQFHKHDEECMETTNDLKIMLDECQQNINTLKSEINALNKQIQNTKARSSIHNNELNQNYKNCINSKNIKNDFIKNVLKLHISDKSSTNHAIGFYQNSEKQIVPLNFHVKKEETDCFWKHFSHKNETVENLRNILNKKYKLEEPSDVITINETISINSQKSN